MAQDLGSGTWLCLAPAMADKGSIVRSAQDLGGGPLSFQPDRLCVCHVGAPLRRSADTDAASTRNAATYEFLFEVRSLDAGVQIRCVQRGLQAVLDLHERLVLAFPSQALPVPPDVGAGALQRIFRTEDTVVKETAKRIETYLNTLLSVPHVCSCRPLLDFLEVPVAGDGSSMQSVHIDGLEEPTDALLAVRSVCQRFCDRFCRAFQLGRRPNGSQIAGEPEPADEMRRRREALLQQHSARAVLSHSADDASPAKTKLAEWQ
uniref:PX domain-containing protein n=1 Tax=Alexandrium andersonii TaxID=327968 RepID=A0A7S2GD31_9DINO